MQDNGNYLTNSNNPQTNWQMTVNGDGAFNYIAPNRDFYVISTQLGNMRKVTLDNNGIILAKKELTQLDTPKTIIISSMHLLLIRTTIIIYTWPLENELQY